MSARFETCKSKRDLCARKLIKVSSKKISPYLLFRASNLSIFLLRKYKNIYSIKKMRLSFPTMRASPQWLMTINNCSVPGHEIVHKRKVTHINCPMCVLPTWGRRTIKRLQSPAMVQNTIALHTISTQLSLIRLRWRNVLKEYMRCHAWTREFYMHNWDGPE